MFSYSVNVLVIWLVSHYLSFFVGVLYVSVSSCDKYVGLIMNCIFLIIYSGVVAIVMIYVHKYR